MQDLCKNWENYSDLSRRHSKLPKVAGSGNPKMIKDGLRFAFEFKLNSKDRTSRLQVCSPSSFYARSSCDIGMKLCKNSGAMCRSGWCHKHRVASSNSKFGPDCLP